MTGISRASGRWIGRNTFAAAWIALLVAAVHPPRSLAFTLCWFQGTTGLPCPGCGMIRSLSCALRGDVQRSWDYHPFGFPFLTLFMILAAISLVSEDRRSKLAILLDRFPQWSNSVYAAFVGSFLTYGLGRLVVHLLSFASHSRLTFNPCEGGWTVPAVLL